MVSELFDLGGETAGGDGDMAGTTTEKDGRDSAKEDLNIEPERPLVDIFEIESNPIREIFYVVAA